MKALPALATVTLKHNELVNDDNTPADRVLFPINSIISVVVDMSDGATAEVGIIGREGMSGLGVALGHPSVNQRSIVQVPDSAHCISVEDFRSAIEHEPELRSFAMRYAQAVLIASGRLSACNALHPVNERCARWLLMAQDRVGGSLLLLTQEFLSQMLGVRRASVALAASELQTAGFISYSRGHITVKNRAGLEAASCECYEAMEYEWKSTMGYGIRTGGATAAPLRLSTLRDGRADGSMHSDGS